MFEDITYTGVINSHLSTPLMSMGKVKEVMRDTSYKKPWTKNVHIEKNHMKKHGHTLNNIKIKKKKKRKQGPAVLPQFCFNLTHTSASANKWMY